MSPLHLLFFLLFILCIGEYTNALAPESHRVELFERGVSTVPFEENGTITQKKAHSYRIPSLVDVDGVMVAIADARYYSSNDNSFIETAVKYSVDDGKTWETQIAVKNSRVSNHSRIVDPTVLVSGNKMYLLVGRYQRLNQYWVWHRDGKDWEPLLVIGEVKKSTVKGKTTASITWTEPVSLRSIFPARIGKAPSKQFLGGASGAIVTTNGTFLIPVQVMNTLRGHIYSTLIRSDDGGKKWSFSKSLVGPGFSEPAVVEWEGKLIMSVRYDYNYRMFFESSDMGGRWKEAVGTLSRVWGTSPKRNQPGSQSSFIAVTIEGKRVMLFTHPLNFHGRWLRDRLHLWVTDNKRIYDVGQVSIGDENSAYSSLLYKNDSLYCLHEINTNEVYSLVFAELIGELKRIKHVIRTWQRMDDDILRRCTFTPQESISSAKDSTTTSPTEGLVGFLSNKLIDGKWEDEYLCVNATATALEKAPNGLIFKEAHSQAEWPVSKQGQNQRYYFANNAFTLVATVTIHEVPKKDSSLMGVAVDSSGEKLFGLLCTPDQKWSVLVNSKKILSTGEMWVPNTSYQVALILQKDGKGTVYVDGKPLEGLKERISGLTRKPGISHFYFGAAGDAEVTRVTVADVLLYNRLLNTDQLNALLPMRESALQPPSSAGTKQDSAESERGTLQQGSVSPTREVFNDVKNVSLKDHQGKDITQREVSLTPNIEQEHKDPQVELHGGAEAKSSSQNATHHISSETNLLIAPHGTETPYSDNTVEDAGGEVLEAEDEEADSDEEDLEDAFVSLDDDVQPALVGGANNTIDPENAQLRSPQDKMDAHLNDATTTDKGASPKSNESLPHAEVTQTTRQDLIGVKGIVLDMIQQNKTMDNTFNPRASLVLPFLLGLLWATVFY